MLILPGINDSGEGHWQTAWQRLIPTAQRVRAPDWTRPVCADWIAALAGAVDAAEDDVVLVAHSLGCLQVAGWAAQLPAGEATPVRAALLVAPPDPALPAFPKEASGFQAIPDRRLPFPSTVVASADDPYASQEFSRRCADRWGSRFVDIGCCGHVNVSSGLGDWQQGRALLAELLAGAGLEPR